MQTIKTPRGSVVIATISEAKKNGLKFTVTSTTEEQPFVTSNFSEEGVNIGGRTATAALVKKFLAEAEKMGCSIEGQI